MEISRRNFLKYASALAGVTALESTDLLSLKSLSSAEAAAAREAMEKFEVKYTACAMCPAECGLEVWIRGGKLWKIYGNKEVPLNDGIACAKGAAGDQLVYSPYRLKYPMIRVGERGLGKFKRITWKGAIDHIAAKLTDIKKKYGAESIIMDTGDVTDRDQYWRLFFAFAPPTARNTDRSATPPGGTGPSSCWGERESSRTS